MTASPVTRPDHAPGTAAADARHDDPAASALDETIQQNGSNGALLSPLDHELCMALYRASHAMTAAYRTELSASGLTYPQFIALSALHRNGPTPVRKIGQSLDLDSSTMSPLLQRLEARALVRRERGTVDEREVVVHLTDTGRELAEQTSDVPANVRRRVGLSGEHIDELVERLDAVTDSLRSRNGASS